MHPLGQHPSESLNLYVNQNAYSGLRQQVRGDVSSVIGSAHAVADGTCTGFCVARRISNILV